VEKNAERARTPNDVGAMRYASRCLAYKRCRFSLEKMVRDGGGLRRGANFAVRKIGIWEVEKQTMTMCVPEGGRTVTAAEVFLVAVGFV
jgi:hypothetical protein